MNENAINDFMFFNDFSFDHGLIDLTCYLERMATLYNLLGVNQEIVVKSLPIYGLNYYRMLAENDNSNELEDLEAIESFGEVLSQNGPDNDVLELYRTNQRGKRCSWEFYNRDADPHPSVPHGHGIQMTSLRLDPFNRKMFEKNHGLIHIGFEDRKFIIALWNDRNFRNYALRAITDFINSGIVGLNYNWTGIRGISNPYRLPRRR